MLLIKKTAILLWLLIFFLVGYSQDTSKISLKELQPALTGCWKGTITYLDYTSGKSFSMPAELKIEQQSSPDLFLFQNFYPEEPKANSIDSFYISADGKKWNDELVTTFKRTSNGDINLITEKMGKDGNDDKAAILRYSYTLTKNTFTRRKDVQFVGTSNWLKRNEFSYSKMPCK